MGLTADKLQNSWCETRKNFKKVPFNKGTYEPEPEIETIYGNEKNGKVNQTLSRLGLFLSLVN